MRAKRQSLAISIDITDTFACAHILLTTYVCAGQVIAEKFVPEKFAAAHCAAC